MDRGSFVDECTVHARGGVGGNGSVSFRREAHVPRGGPDGGDGGRGGHVIFVADVNTSSLIDLHRAPHLRGGDGGHGAGMGRDGPVGEDRIARVPIGTVVRERDSQAVLADLVENGQRYVAAEGGRGGRGNVSFTNRHRRLPTFAERGEQTFDVSLRLELKLIADVGLVGFPSAGKSSLVGRLSAAKPRVADWPFTTLTPHLGVMRAGDTHDGRPIDVVLADVPGLIEGASEGRGLGLQFLRHIERCHVLLHVLDGMPYEADRDPEADLAVLLRELAAHDPDLVTRPNLVVITKVDLPDAKVMAELARPNLESQGYEVLEVSTVTSEGLDTLRYRLGELVERQRQQRASDEAAALQGAADGSADAGGRRSRSGAQGTPEGQEVLVRLLPRGRDFTVEVADDGYVVHGRRIARWVQMLPIEDPQAARYLQGRMRRAGVEKALIAAGARSGDDVFINDVVFTFEPDIDDLPAEERAEILAAEAEADADDVEHADLGDLEDIDIERDTGE
ncbi:MAG: GTPase ObgE [Nitriliruptoraceae bacterium]